MDEKGPKSEEVGMDSVLFIFRRITNTKERPNTR